MLLPAATTTQTGEASRDPMVKKMNDDKKQKVDDLGRRTGRFRLRSLRLLSSLVIGTNIVTRAGRKIVPLPHKSQIRAQASFTMLPPGRAPTRDQVACRIRQNETH
jgi:hypothetical protein